MTKRKIIPILVVLILLFIASQFNAFGSLMKLTGKLIETVKMTITKVGRILMVKEKDTEEVVEIQLQKQTTISRLQKESTSATNTDNLMSPIRKKKLENGNWEDEMPFYPFSDNVNDDFYKKPKYDDAEIEASDDWDAFLESLTIEIFSLSDEDYSEYNDEEAIDSLLSSDELSSLELWLNSDKKKSKEIEDSISESPEFMDEFDDMIK